MNNCTYLCTCMINKTHGYPCRHFYRVMTFTPTARFHIGLVNRRWYKDELQGTDISNNEFVVISLNKLASKTHSLSIRFLQSSSLCEFNTDRVREVAISNDEISKVISKKRKFGELWGLGRKIIIDAIENSDEDIYNELLEFFLLVQRRSLPRIIDDNHSVNNTNNNNIMMEIRNPVERKPKGRPKTKRIKSVIESDIKIQYKCKLCKQKSHNSKTCKANKENEV